MSTARLSAAVTPKVLSTSHRHLANRFTFGVSEQLTTEMLTVASRSLWFERQLAYATVTDTPAAPILGWFPHLQDSPSKAWSTVKSGGRSGWDYGYDFVAYSIARKVLSRRQVHEVMVDFWSNLLYIPAGEDRSFPWRLSYDQAIRKNALGTYRGLLRAAVVHPAMSGWLNNSANTKDGINENLGRELLELFTVGRPAGYDEDDVKNSARLLTGFKVKVFDGYAASYSTADHWVGPVSILGFKHKNASRDGRAAVNAYLDYLARHPATANRIAKRLCVKFVSDTPSASIVNAVAKAYRLSDTSIKATLRALIAHPEFAASREAKVRMPIEDVVHAARVLGLKPSGGSASEAFVKQAVWMSQDMGQAPYYWPRPDGFPETSSTWTSPARVLRTWNMHYSLAGNWWHSKQLTIPAKVNQLPTTWPCTIAQLVEHQSRVLLGRPATAELTAAVASTLNLAQTHTIKSAADVTDWGWTVLRAGILNMPEGMLR